MKELSFADWCLELSEKTSPGPWAARVEWDDLGLGCITRVHASGPVYPDKKGRTKARRDAEFIAAAREIVPALADRLNYASEQLRKIAGTLNRNMPIHPDFLIDLAEELEAPL